MPETIIDLHCAGDTMAERTKSLKVINTDAFSRNLRLKAIDVNRQRLLITRFTGSKQEEDLTEPANCNGIGRIRHFRRQTSAGWPTNPLPIDPASHALGIEPGDVIRAQAFQNSICNWRCWYCFVDFELLSGNERHSIWVTADEIVELYLSQPDPPPVIDLTGGQPDLTPEWVPWMMDALEKRGLGEQVYLWSDDNLSNDYFWKYLDEGTRSRVARYSLYGRVCCFKGYNPESFSFNTLADPDLFERQFEMMRRLVDLGLDIYCYVTLTTPSVTHLESDMSTFVERLISIDPLLPLRVVPLEIRPFSPVVDRLDEVKLRSMSFQNEVVGRWRDEIERRFSASELDQPIWSHLMRSS